jgi:hypothetical protein
MEPQAGFATFDQHGPFSPLRREGSSQKEGLCLHEPIHHPVCEVIAKSRAKFLPLTQSIKISESVEVPASGTFGRREEVRQEDRVIFRVAGINPLVVNGRWKGTVATMAKVLSDNFVLI